MTQTGSGEREQDKCHATHFVLKHIFDNNRQRQKITLRRTKWSLCQMLTGIHSEENDKNKNEEIHRGAPCASCIV